MGNDLIDKDELIHAIHDDPNLDFQDADVIYTVRVIERIIRDLCD